MSTTKYFLSLLSISLLILCASCSDPCYDLAKKICNCRKDEDKRRQCINELNLASSHRGHERARNEKVCKLALKECSCQDLNSGTIEKCGLQRN